ncbi:MULTISPECIES: hypothetical protein [unclassified Mycobacterium]|uniref:hypothetical protein n=1 Tax=unclassified Mycobacterium TaxID=2642494 RepID=UPI00114D445B|nr:MULTISPECIES: hypothetical protein [unclassified Mycobacterium]
MQPPEMPSAPGGYNGGSYPAPDQNNGISIYNSDAPQGSDGDSQAATYPQSQQPANGTQPPDYDHPISQQPSAQPQQHGQQQHESQQATPTQQPSQSASATPSRQPSQSQQSSPTQTSSPNREDQQHKDRDCQGISGLSSVTDGKVIYTAPTQIADQVSAAAQQWNNLGGIQIVPASDASDGRKSQEDNVSGDRHSNSDQSGDTSGMPAVTLNISTIADPLTPWGGEYTSGDDSSPGEIIINLARIPAAGPGGIQSVLGHELGHALGLDDNIPGQLMAPSGALPNVPQAIDIQLLQQIGNQGATQQCAAQRFRDALQEFWCPFGTNADGSCTGAGVARSTGDFFSGVGKDIWGDVTDIGSLIAELTRASTGNGESQTALRQALGPLFGLGPEGSIGLGDAWTNLGLGTLNQLIGLDKWQSGQYKEAMERVTANIVEIAATVGVGALLKFVRRIASAVRDAKSAVEVLNSIIAPGKLDYIFGKVTSSPKNTARSISMLRQLNAIGVFDNAEGRKLVQQSLESAAKATDNVAKEEVRNGVTTLTKDSLLIGPGGVLKLESFWEVTSDGLRLTSVIPYGM